MIRKNTFQTLPSIIDNSLLDSSSVSIMNLNGTSSLGNTRNIFQREVITIFHLHIDENYSNSFIVLVIKG